MSVPLNAQEGKQSLCQGPDRRAYSDVLMRWAVFAFRLRHWNVVRDSLETLFWNVVRDSLETLCRGSCSRFVNDIVLEQWLEIR